MEDENHHYHGIEVEGEKAVTAILALADSLDSNSFMNLVSSRLFDHYTSWDIMMNKAKLVSNAGDQQGLMQAVIDDTIVILSELRVLIQSTMDPITSNKTSVKRNKLEFVELDDLLTGALGLDCNMWVKKDNVDIHYRHDAFDPQIMFPTKIMEDEQNNVKKDEDEIEIKKEIGYEPQDVSQVKRRKKRRAKIREEIMEALEDTHGTDQEFQAPVEKKKRGRKRKAEINLPVKTEQQEEPKKTYECPKCSKPYHCTANWYKHMENSCGDRANFPIEIKTENENSFTCGCDGCPESETVFQSKDDAHDHWALHHATEDQKFVPCFECEEKFATVFAQKIHMSEIHENSELLKDGTYSEDDQKNEKEKYLCLKCGASMSKETGMKHEAKCTGFYCRKPEYKKIGNEIFCTVQGCNIGYSFSSMYGLRKHFHTTHTREEEKIFACDFCDEKFSFKTARNLHITEKHAKSHVCDICGRGFGGKSKMESHRLLHTGEKPFACDKCDYRAVKKCNYESHMESKHGIFAQKNFLCGICNKQFVTMGRVRRHMNEMHGKMEDTESSARRKRRAKRAAAPPVDKQLVKKETRVEKRIMPALVEEEVVVPTMEHETIMIQHQPDVIQYEDQEAAAVHYIHAELSQGDDRRVITITPLS